MQGRHGPDAGKSLRLERGLGKRLTERPSAPRSDEVEPV
jgi:hypothetical protein